MGGSSQKQTQQSTSTNTLDPAYAGLLDSNYQGAQAKAASLTPYTGQLTAGFTPTQTQAQGVLSTVANDPQYAANNNTATSTAAGITGYSPTNVNASTIANTDLSQYENPFQSQVIDASVAQNERARQIAQVADAQKASAASAFGGSRSGVMAAGTNEAYDRNNQQNIAALNSANFTQAQQAASTDAATNNQVGEFNATNANTGAGIRLNAAGQLVSDNTAALNTAATQGGILGAVGDAQQNQNQTELTNAYNNYLAGNQLTIEQQTMLNQALGLIPATGTTSSSGTGTTTQSGGLGGILGGIASLGLGVGSLGSTSLLGGALGRL